MSLWLDSFSSSYHYCESDKERRKCVLCYLSMPVPRMWWENCLDDNEVIGNFAGLMKDICKDFEGTGYLNEADYSSFVALAFIDEERKEEQQAFGMMNNEYSIEDYFTRATKILLKKPELNKLGKMIAQHRKEHNA